jgi:hypothetical protein
MALAPTVEGSQHTAQLITWLKSDGTPVNLTNATITGIIENIEGAARSIDGTLSVTDADEGIFQWDYGAEDVSTAGIFQVQFRAEFSSTDQSDYTFSESWYVSPQLGDTSGTLMSYQDYDAVRAAIDISLVVEPGSKQIIPDRIISMPIYQGMAEEYVKSVDPDYETRTGYDRISLKSAVILLTAANLVPRIPFLLREDFGDYNYSRHFEKGQLDKLAASLKSQANEALNSVLGLDVYASMPVMFDVAPGRRGV